MKILVCCGNGLGSSFMIEMNIKKALQEIGAEAEVSHCDLASAGGVKADIYVGKRDIARQLTGLGGEVVSLNNMIDKKELTEKIAAAVAKVKG